jgi:polysaccharide biosynthesis protein PslH
MVSPVMPALTGNGLSMRTGLFLQALASIADVELLVVPAFGHVSTEGAEWATKASARVRVLDCALQDTHFGLIARLTDPSTRLDTFAKDGRPSISGFLSAATIRKATNLLRGEEFDLVHVERSYCAPLGCAIGTLANGAPVLTIDLDEDDSRLYTTLAGLAVKMARSDEERWNLLEATAFRRLLDDTLPLFNRIWVSSAIDVASLALSANSVEAHILPNSVITAGRAHLRDDGRTLLFVGSLGYAPNQDAVSWFLSAIWPRLSKARNLRLQIVGPNAPAGLQRRARQRGVEMLGWVPDPARYYATATLTIVPIRAGAGTRIKLIESAFFGVPAVSTAVGAEGLGLRHGQHLWIADTAKAFVKAVHDALDRPAERQRRAYAARAQVTAAFDRETTVRRLSREFLALL